MPNGSLLGGYNYPSKSVSISVPASVRYIRWYANGNQFNGSTHFCELQALTAGGTNRALDAGTNGRVSQYTGASPEQTMNNSVWQLATNGDTSSGSYFGFGGAAGIQFDLGAIYTDISQIKFWNYYADARTYNSVTIFVSSDGTTWTTLYGPTNTASNSSGIAVTVPPATGTAVTSFGMWRLEEQYAAKRTNTWQGVSATVTGGTVTTSGAYTIRTFTANGTLSVTGGTLVADVLVVGGGGGGGNGGANYCGGGGAGGLIQGSSVSLSGSLPIVIGAGGGLNAAGSSTTFSSYTAVGGGQGASSYYATGGSGGSGGGGGPTNGAGGAATSGQGNVGGVASSANAGGSDSGAGGGGGAGGAGYDRSSPGGYRNSPGGGGEALQLSISGSAQYYAAGGVGAGYYYGDRVSNIGGGTSGYNYPQFQNIQIDANGSANTGSGGGGKGWAQGGGSGGSGIVIIRYLTP
jgi:hypothetical protein